MASQSLAAVARPPRETDSIVACAQTPPAFASSAGAPLGQESPKSPAMLLQLHLWLSPRSERRLAVARRLVRQIQLQMELLPPRMQQRQVCHCLRRTYWCSREEI